MGLTISYKFKTTSGKKIASFIKDMKAYAENQKREFRVYEDEGFILEDTIRIQKLSGEVKIDKRLSFASQADVDNMGKIPSFRKLLGKSKRITLEIELKALIPGSQSTFYWITMYSQKDGRTWIGDDFRKVMAPSGRPAQVVSETIQIIAILEYMKENYFPNMTINDETDFHIDLKNNPNIGFWKAIMAGKHPSYKRSDGTFPDYKADYKKKKHHDIQNILDSIGEIQGVFAIIEKQLAQVGFSEEDILKGVKITKEILPTKELSLEFIGDQVVERIKNEISGISITRVRPRRIDLTRGRVKDSRPHRRQIEFKRRKD